MNEINFEDTSIKDLVGGFTDEQKKIALKYFPIEFMYEEIDRRKKNIDEKVNSIKAEVDKLTDNTDIKEANEIFGNLVKILSTTK